MFYKAQFTFSNIFQLLQRNCYVWIFLFPSCSGRMRSLSRDIKRLRVRLLLQEEGVGKKHRRRRNEILTHGKTKGLPAHPPWSHLATNKHKIGCARKSFHTYGQSKIWRENFCLQKKKVLLCKSRVISQMEFSQQKRENESVCKLRAWRCAPII